MTDNQLAAEVRAGHESAVLLERSDWGRVRVAGADRATFLHNMTTQDIKGLTPGQGASAVVINQRAQILDHVDVYATPDSFFVITGPGKAESTLAWWDRYLITEDVQLSDLTADTCLFYITGAKAAELLGAVLPEAQNLGEFRYVEGNFVGVPVRLVSTYGLFGPGFHLVGEASGRDALLAHLTSAGLTPISEAAFEVLRVEAGLPMVGRELTEQQNPWEARLDQSLSLSKGCYLGQEIVARLNTYDKVQRYLVGLALPGKDVPDAAPKLVADDKEIGFVTSAVVPPEGDHAVALGYVKGAYAQPGTTLTMKWGEAGELTVTTRDLPFWEGKTRQVGPISKA